MLSWLSGDGRARIEPPSGVRAADGYASHEDDPPETPAHVFAARAFKHAIFGTPAPPPTQRPPRERPQSWDGKRSKSRTTTDATDTAGLRAENRRPASSDGPGRFSTLDSSPARRPGILLTPGTGGTRRKTVSFGGGYALPDAQARATAKQRPTSRDSTDDAPDIWASQNASGLHPRRREIPDFAEKLRGSDGAPGSVAQDQVDVTLDMNAPRSRSGRYWKTEYESHVAKTSTEIRKLAKKEQVAKKYAKHRDSTASKLEEELQREQQKAAKLEVQVEDFRNRISNAVKDTASSKSREAQSSKHEPDMPTSGHSHPTSYKDEREAQQELQTLRSANQRLQDRARKQQNQSNVNDQAKEEHIGRLQTENDALRAELRSLRRGPPSASHRERSTAVPASDPASDIWADAGGQGQDTKSPRRRLSKSRPPLTQRDDNIAPVESTEQDQAKRESRLSEERRIAAIRRLEERKKAKQQTVLAAAAANAA